MSTQREWTTIREYEDILFDYYNGIARITINRERYRNAFTPTTTAEMSDALRICREEADIDVIVITGAGDKAWRLYRQGRCSPSECSGCTETNPQHSETGNCCRKWICHWWRTRASCSLRFIDCFGECDLRTDRSSRR